MRVLLSLLLVLGLTMSATVFANTSMTGNNNMTGNVEEDMDDEDMDEEEMDDEDMDEEEMDDEDMDEEEEESKEGRDVRGPSSEGMNNMSERGRKMSEKGRETARRAREGGLKEYKKENREKAEVLDESTKTQIDSAVDKAVEGMSGEDKKEFLNTVLERVNEKKEQIQNAPMLRTTKVKVLGILSHLKMTILTQLEEMQGDLSEDELLDSLLSK